MVDMLIHNGADTNIRAPFGESALYIAASRNYVHGFAEKCLALRLACVASDSFLLPPIARSSSLMQCQHKGAAGSKG